jgi:23S rRNA pseudouridine2605 synthase
MTQVRLHKLMASCGVGSRRACEEIIAQGRVDVDGEVVTQPGTQVDPETQTVRVDSQVLHVEPPLHYLLYKPRGAICSATSAPGTPRALDFLPPRARDRRMFTIGRLDVDSDGAIILTNDGELCHLVTHPRFGVGKTYRVEVEGEPTDETIERMRHGVWLAEGRTGTVDVQALRRARDRSLLLVTLHEGKKREIRRVCARFGHEVRRLTRVAVGPVQLGDLAPGQVRMLTRDELAALRAAAQAVIRLGGGGRGTVRLGARPAKRAHGVPGREFHANKREALRGRAAFARKRREAAPRRDGLGAAPHGRLKPNRHAGQRRGERPAGGRDGGGRGGGPRGGGGGPRSGGGGSRGGGSRGGRGGGARGGGGRGRS